jgi:hypothetical protein
MIKVGDIVLHQLSGLFYRCENKKMERWMNMNDYYIAVPDFLKPDPSYFHKHK